jgi:adenylate kinase
MQVARMQGRKKASKLLIGITGTPGVGKTYFSKLLEKKLKSFGITPKVIEINDVVLKAHAYNRTDKSGSKIIIRKKLRDGIKKEINSSGVTIVVGHLLPETDLHPDICIVLRQDLKTLAERLAQRHYSIEKIRENLLAEAYDDIGTKIMRICKESYEVEKNSSRKSITLYICAIALGKKPAKPKHNSIDKFEELEKLILKGNRFRF